MNESEEFLEGLAKIQSRAPRAYDPTKAPTQEPPAQKNGGWLYRFWRDDWGMNVVEQPHEEMANRFESVLGDCMFQDRRRLIMCGYPRGTYKTTGYSEATPVAILTKNPNAKMLLEGFRHQVSKIRLRAIRKKIEGDPHLASKYGTDDWKPQFRSDTWNDEEIIIPRTDLLSREGSIMTAGPDRSMNSMHFDLIIADDLVTDTNSRTAEGRDKIYDHIFDLLPILSPTGVLMIVFTTWHVDDAYARIIKMEAELKRRNEAPRFEIYMHGCYDGPNGLFAPTILSHEFLEETRETIGERKFAAQYLLKPVADEDKTFNMDAMKLRPFIFLSVPEREQGGVVRLLDRVNYQVDVETTMAWDPAGRKPGKTTDSHGFTVVGTDVMDVWWILEAISKKGATREILNLACQLIERYRPWAVSVEDVGGYGLWIDLLMDELVRRNLATGVREYSTGGVPKNERIVMLEPRWPSRIIMRADRQGRVMHQTLYNQMDAFSPGGQLAHEDVLDSLVQHHRLTRKPEQRVVEPVRNPLDPEYAAFRQRQQAEAGGSQAGVFGPIWTA